LGPEVERELTKVRAPTLDPEQYKIGGCRLGGKKCTVLNHRADYGYRNTRELKRSP